MGEVTQFFSYRPTSDLKTSIRGVILEDVNDVAQDSNIRALTLSSDFLATGVEIESKIVRNSKPYCTSDFVETVIKVKNDFLTLQHQFRGIVKTDLLNNRRVEDSTVDRAVGLV